MHYLKCSGKMMMDPLHWFDMRFLRPLVVLPVLLYLCTQNRVNGLLPQRTASQRRGMSYALSSTSEFQRMERSMTAKPITLPDPIEKVYAGSLLEALLEGNNQHATKPTKIVVNEMEGKISFDWGQSERSVLLEGIDRGAVVDYCPETGGAFISFKFQSSSSQHDAIVGKVPKTARLLAHSRIKRWWMAPSFPSTADDVPVETQLLLLEIPVQRTQRDLEHSDGGFFHEFDQETWGAQFSSDIFGLDVTGSTSQATDADKSEKMYAVIVPLIDFDRGFRTTLYGGKEGGAPCTKGVLAARIESGDPKVCTAMVDTSLYVGAGTDPYDLLESAYKVIASKMGTFRTRKSKMKPPGIDSFGFCTWDAFYSSVDSEKVVQGLDSLASAGVNVKYVILDDGWQSTALSGKQATKKGGALPARTQTTQTIQTQTQTHGQDKGQEKSRVGSVSGRTGASTALSSLTGGYSLSQSHTPASNNNGGEGDTTTAAAAATAATATTATVASDGELSGAQIDGSMAAQKILEAETSPVLQFATKVVADFYSNMVEQGEPNSWPVKLWTTLSQKTMLKGKLIEFFAVQTDFSKRLTSWKANSKFEDEAAGKSLKSFVQNLKEQRGIDYVFVWHALSGYWGGVSEDLSDELTSALWETSGGGDDNGKGNSPGGSMGVDTVGTVGGSASGAASAAGAGVGLGPRLRKTSWPKRLRWWLRMEPEKLTETLTEQLTVKLNEGLLQLSQKALALANLSVRAGDPPIKLSFSHPTPHLLLVEPALGWDPSALVGVGSVSVNKLEMMYSKMHAYLSESGIDGVKVDAQSGIGAFGAGNGGGPTIAQACVRAVENSVKVAFGRPPTALPEGAAATARGGMWSLLRGAGGGGVRGLFGPRSGALSSAATAAAAAAAAGTGENRPVALVGCMCHSSETLYNYFETGMIRASDDFYPKDNAAQTVHVASCAYNSVMLGEISQTDWDMFHSKHPFAAVHAAARAVSGGPVYVSDSPGKHDSALLRRLVLPDGGILRAQLPARPTVDCLFRDVMNDGRTCLKVWNHNKVGAVAGVFNVQGSSWDRKQRRYVQHVPYLALSSVDAELRPRDIGTGGPFSAPTPLASHAQYVAWSAAEKKATLLGGREDALRLHLKPKGWDVVSLFRVMAVPLGEGERRRRAGRERRRRGWGLGLGLGYFGREEGEGGAEQEECSPTETGLGEVDQSRAIFWAPLGLIDFLNAGGAVEEVLSGSSMRPAKGDGRYAGMGVRRCAGGRVGAYTSHPPREVLVDGVSTPFTYQDLEAHHRYRPLGLGLETLGTLGLDLGPDHSAGLEKGLERVESLIEEARTLTTASIGQLTAAMDVDIDGLTAAYGSATYGDDPQLRLGDPLVVPQQGGLLIFTLPADLPPHPTGSEGRVQERKGRNEPVKILLVW